VGSEVYCLLYGEEYYGRVSVAFNKKPPHDDPRIETRVGVITLTILIIKLHKKWF
jgi:hypothetical protein